MIAAVSWAVLAVSTFGTYALLGWGHFRDMDPAEYRRPRVGRTPDFIPLALPDIEGMV